MALLKIIQEQPSYFIGRGAAAGAAFAIVPNQVYRVDGPIPPAIVAFERSHVIERLEREPAPETAVLRLTREHLEATDRPDPVVERPVRLGDLCAALGLSVADVRAADEFIKFPPKVGGVAAASAKHPGAPDEPTFYVSQWRQWLRERRTLAARVFGLTTEGWQS